MAKKTKRKVSQVVEAARVAETTVERTASDTPSVAAPQRSFSRRSSLSTEFNPDYTYIIKDLKRIGILAGSFFLLLIVLAFVMPIIMP